MLTKQHQFASRLQDPKMQFNYRSHMCGLCHELGSQYGHDYRLFTSHELTLLGMISNAQIKADPINVNKRCPLDPSHLDDVVTGDAMRYSGAASVILGMLSIKDHLDDKDQPGALNKFQNWLFDRKVPQAIKTLNEFGVNTDQVININLAQSKMENNHQDPSEPSANLAAELFAGTANISGIEHNKTVLREIGRNYGRFVYWMDAYLDYLDDISQGKFNPLISYSRIGKDAVILSDQAYVVLSERMEMIYGQIVEHLEKLNIYRYRADLLELLVAPVGRIAQGLRRNMVAGQSMEFRRWTFWDFLKAATFFISPKQIKFSPLQTIPLVFAASTQNPCESLGDSCGQSGKACESGGEACRDCGDGSNKCLNGISCNA